MTWFSLGAGLSLVLLLGLANQAAIAAALSAYTLRIDDLERWSVAAIGLGPLALVGLQRLSAVR